MAFSSLFPGMRKLFFGHGECIIWLNFCVSHNIPNLGFPQHVLVRLMTQPSTTLQYLSDKALFIFRFRPHVIIFHLGMYDLSRPMVDPLALADRYWHSVGLILACFVGDLNVKVIFLGQPCFPWHISPDRLFPERVDAFHSRLL